MNIDGWGSRVWKVIGLFMLVFAGAIAAIAVTLGVGVLLLGEDILGGRTYAETWTPALGCNVVGIAVRGPITISGYGFAPEECPDGMCAQTTSDEVIEYLRTAGEDSEIKAVLLDIESPGGEPVASEEIAYALQETGKPSVAWVRQVAASGAYWIASAAGTIVASPNSDVGSIGVSMSYMDYADQNATEGIYYNQLTSAPFKDAGSPEKILTEEEAALFQRDLDITHDNFVGVVAANRGLSYEAVAALADGSTMLGVQALENGLIDQLGGRAEAYAALAEAIGEEPVVCWGGL